MPSRALLIAVVAAMVALAAAEANDACVNTNTTFVGFDGICIHSDHSGYCGVVGKDEWNVVLDSNEECQALCCENPDLCVGYIWYSSYKSSCCTGEGCHGNVTTPPSDPGAPCCWLKSSISPAHLWSNDEYCTNAGVVYVPGPL